MTVGDCDVPSTSGQSRSFPWPSPWPPPPGSSSKSPQKGHRAKSEPSVTPDFFSTLRRHPRQTTCGTEGFITTPLPTCHPPTASLPISNNCGSLGPFTNGPRCHPDASRHTTPNRQRVDPRVKPARRFGPVWRMDRPNPDAPAVILARRASEWIHGQTRAALRARMTRAVHS